MAIISETPILSPVSESTIYGSWAWMFRRDRPDSFIDISDLARFFPELKKNISNTKIKLVAHDNYGKNRVRVDVKIGGQILDIIFDGETISLPHTAFTFWVAFIARLRFYLEVVIES